MTTPTSMNRSNLHPLLSAWHDDRPNPMRGTAYSVSDDGRVTRGGSVVGVWYELAAFVPAMPPKLVVATRDDRPHAVTAWPRGLASPRHPPAAEVALGLLNDRTPPFELGWTVEAVAFGDVVAQVAASLAGDADWYSTMSFAYPPATSDDDPDEAGKELPRRPLPVARGPEHAFRGFLSTLDPVAVDALRTGRVPRVARQCWDGLDATFGGDGCLLKALSSLPDLSETLASAWVADPDGFASDMRHRDPWAIVRREACRQGIPRRVAAAMPEALARMPPPPTTQTWGIRPKARLETKVHLNNCGLHVPSPPGAMGAKDPILGRLAHLSHLPPDRLPCGKGWHAYARAATFLHAIRHRTGDEHLNAALGISGADWTGFVDGLRDLRRDGQPGRGIADVGDHGRAYARQVVGPALHMAKRQVSPDRATKLALVVLNSGRTVRSWIAESERWHAHATTIDAALAALPGAVHVDPPWLPYFPDMRVGDIDVRVLTSVADLVAEGAQGDDAAGVAGLAHCVGGYGPQCRAGTSRILSLSRTGVAGRRARLSTAEIDFNEGGQWTVPQHRGAGNADPPLETVEALHAYLAATASPGMVRPSDLRPVPEPDDGSAGYDLLTPGNWEAAREAWAPFVPRAARGLTPEDWARIDDLSGPLTSKTWLPSSPALTVLSERQETEPGGPRP